MNADLYKPEASQFVNRKLKPSIRLCRQPILPLWVFVLLFLIFAGQRLSVKASAPISSQSEADTSTPSADVPVEADTFVFAAGGDIGANRRADASLRAIPATGAAFFLALGDMDYDETHSDAAWCEYVKARVGSTFPFEILTGNHEEGSATRPGPDGYIGNHAACLPDYFNSTPLIPGMQGYPANYYFDYPQTDPFLRVIMISADLKFEGVTYTFDQQEQTNYNALAAAIDQAKQAGFWVVVGVHKVCLTAGGKPCEIGSDLTNLLIERKVDLVLQGHDHNYQRSKQIALGDTCTGIVPESYNANCIVDDGSDNTYTRGAGTVFVISGVMGRCCYPINVGDSEAGYFASMVGDDGIVTSGFVTYTVSRTRIDAQVIPSVGAWGDHFSIAEAGSAPPTLTATPTSPDDVPTPPGWTFTPVADSYVRASEPSDNFGRLPVLRTDGSPEVHSYLRFDVQAVEGTITSATLRLYANSASSRGFTVRRIADNAWDESTITYDTAPALDATLRETAGFGAGTWIAIDVTPFIQGNGLVSLAITPNSSTAISFSSREGANPPQLIITAELPETTATAEPTTVMPTAAIETATAPTTALPTMTDIPPTDAATDTAAPPTDTPLPTETEIAPATAIPTDTPSVQTGIEGTLEATADTGG